MESKWFDKIVGDNEPDRDIPSLIDRHVDETNKSFQPDIEIEKTQRDMAIINYTAKAVIDMLVTFGRVESSNLHTADVHLVPEGGVAKLYDNTIGNGATSDMYKYMIIDRFSSDAQFAVVLCHELLHRQAFSSVTVAGKNTFNMRRSGFQIRLRNKNIAFESLDEGIVDFMAQVFYKNYIVNNPSFDQVDDENELFPRSKETAMFKELVKELLRANPERSEGEIIKMFINARLNGNLMPIARLIEKTFGKGSFRSLGESDDWKSGKTEFDTD